MASTESLFLRELYTTWTERMSGQDLPAMRNMFDDWHRPTVEPTEVTYEELDVAGIPALFANPVHAADDRAILYFHGGGFAVGSRHSHRKLAAHLAKAAGVRALVIDFRRAPENPYPAQLEDALIAYRWLLENGFAANHVATAGDSAGGNLAISTALKLAALGAPPPAATVALSPWLDMELTGETLATKCEVDVLVTRPLLEGMREMFLGTRGSPTDPLANPLLADLSGLPPLFISVGGDETLLADSTRLAELARKAEVDVVLDVVPEQQHVFVCLAGRAPEADGAVARIGAFLASKMDE
jgi:acetyl esterase/lipase